MQLVAFAGVTGVQRGDVHRVKDIVIAAVVAVHVDIAVLLQHFRHFFGRQRQQRIGAALARTGAAEQHVLRFVQGDFFLMVQAIQHLVGRQAEQLFALHRVGQLHQMVEIVGVAVLRRQNLQQHAGRGRFALRFAGADEQAGRQLFRLTEVGFQAGGQGFPFQADHA